jgi:hypothetical protein
MAHQFHLKVNALDGEETFFEALGNGAVVHPLIVQFLGHLDVLLADGQALMLGEVGEQGHQAEGIIQIF